MTATPGNLSAALGLEARDHIAIVGAGGKSTLLFTLAKDLCQLGRKVVTTTTTKIRLREAEQAPLAIYFPDGAAWEHPLKEAIEKYGHAFVSRKALSSGKVKGITTASADGLFQAPWVDYLLVEADGAAGRPIKVPGSDEPVIPDSVTVVIAVVGLDALNARCVEENVFRIDEFHALTGIRPGARISPEVLTAVFGHPKGLFKGAPAKARRIGFLNKTDVVEDLEEARHLAGSILQCGEARVERVVLGSLHNKQYTVFPGGNE